MNATYQSQHLFLVSLDLIVEGLYALHIYRQKVEEVKYRFPIAFLYGILNGKSIDECLKKGAEVAASVVQVFEPWVE